ncbi:MAG: NAD(P)/FAD-dependent oxidoreductase [Candidatus Bipolaricaulota bacterium]|nr:NAD(P)/FAD-dependent oxidoreductase [Candidatus Bipolaricaulota bacterium]MDW8126591.1 geranylgeranyl reductase family protein [Candidatus Bipolaricaulota bacterium]
MKFQVVVVGGGPAGAIAARASAEAKAKTLLLEPAPKKAVCCAGLVSLATAERLGVPKSLFLREIRAVKVFFPGGNCVELRAEEAKAVVLDRDGLNQWLRNQAQEKGVELWPAAARAWRTRQLLTTCGLVEFDVLIGADGAQSTVAHFSGLPRPQEVLVAAQAEIRAELGDMVEVHLGVVPDFFAWAVPAAEGVAKVGLATGQGREAVARLGDFLTQRFPDAPVLSVRTGLIPIGPPSKTVADHVILVGNAAAQVKPLTGGGLAFISRCAPLAGTFAARGPEGLFQYEACWRKMLGEEIAFEQKARHLFLRLGPEALVDLSRILSNPEIIEFLTEGGDIDDFSSLPKKFFSRPALWSTVLPLLRWLSPQEFF